MQWANSILKFSFIADLEGLPQTFLLLLTQSLFFPKEMAKASTVIPLTLLDASARDTWVFLMQWEVSEEVEIASPVWKVKRGKANKVNLLDDHRTDFIPKSTHTESKTKSWFYSSVYPPIFSTRFIPNECRMATGETRRETKLEFGLLPCRELSGSMKS
jgi:hypothetical protein